MLVLNMGIPRSGTTWSFNVLRNIYTVKGQQCETINPQGGLATDAALHSAPKDGNVIIHSHDITKNVIEYARRQNCAVFFNIRDPRDVVVSLMHLHNASFTEAVKMAVSSFRSLQATSCIPNIMIIPYDQIGPHSEALIFQMGLRLGHYLSPTTLSTISDRTSISKHRRMMEQVIGQDDLYGDKIKSIFSGRRNVRYDTKTLITDRHIQSGKSGRWKDELDSKEQDDLNRIFAVIINQLGFD